MFTATAEANNLAAEAAARERCTALLEWVCDGANSCVGPVCLEGEHQKIKNELLNQFISTHAKWDEKVSLNHTSIRTG
jgi:hypothetical protein